MKSGSSNIKEKTENAKFSDHKRVHLLVIRLSAMGDVAMLAPVLQVLTTTYPQLKITVLTKKFFAPIFFGIDNVVIYEADLKGAHNGVFGLSSLAKDLRDLGVDAVADVHNVLRTNVLKSIFFLFGIPVKQIDKGRAEKKALIRENNKIFKQLKPTLERYADVFKELGYPLDLSKYRYPQKQRLSPNAREITGKNTLKWLGIAPFAQHNSKVYPLDLLAKVLEKLNADGNVQIYLFGGGKEEQEKLESLASKLGNATSLVGKLKFEEELALISNLDGMLSMDSGNAHLAAIFGIPVVTLWGVTHPYAGFKAFSQPLENCLLPDLQMYPKIPTSIYGNKFPEGYEDVMRTISPEIVYNKINEVLFS